MIYVSNITYAFMISLKEQYKFVHEALLEALMCTSSDPSSAEFPKIYGDLLKVDDTTGKRNIDVHFEVCLDTREKCHGGNTKD